MADADRAPIVSGRDVLIGAIQLVALIGGLTIANAVAPVQQSAAVLQERVEGLRRDMADLKERVMALERKRGRLADAD
jgi:Tfp pilus assembly protein PilN